MMRRTFVLCLLFCATVLAPQGVGAHTRSQSLSALSIDGDTVTVDYKVSAREVTRLGVLDPQAETLPALLAGHLATSLRVMRGDVSCQLRTAPKVRVTQVPDMRFELDFICPQSSRGQPVSFSNNAFFPVASRHIHFARAKSPSGGFEEQLMTASQREVVFAFAADGSATQVEESAARILLRYIVLGAEHIWIGIDHLAFLVGLLLLCSRLKDVVLVVTGFTVGHSITLSLTVLGLAVPNPPVVEALIAFTIVLVAVESLVAPTGLNGRSILVASGLLIALGVLDVFLGSSVGLSVWLGLALLAAGYGWLTRDTQTARRLLPALTTIFGLIHGFGFAGVLLELGLPDGRLALALFGFNVGVELGQIVFVSALWLGALVLGTKMQAPVRISIRTGAAALLCVAGSYWFALRAFA